jgi:hypothetical protein
MRLLQALLIAGSACMLPVHASALELPATMEPPPSKPPASAGATSSPARELPEEEIACRARLRDLGVSFEELQSISDPGGCHAAHPLSVSRVAKDVELRPTATLSCAMAEATARFVQNKAAPAVRKEFGSDLAVIEQVSSYVCRPRNGTPTLSEHAFANALDWGTLTLAGGTQIAIKAYRRTEPRRARLLSRLRNDACGPFKTVLGPGSDADHADHFHFDMAERRNGATFCQ